MVWGGRRENGNFVAAFNRWSAAMPQPKDLSRSLVALDRNNTIIAAVELSQSSWLVAGVLPGIERQPRKKLEPSPERLLAVLHGWRMRRSGPVTRSRGLRWPSMPAATASGWRAGFFGGPAELTIRGGGNRETNMALMPENGPAARSFAANAHDCIMVRIRMDLPHTSLRRKDAPQWRAPLGFVSKALSDAGASEMPLSLYIVPSRAQASSPQSIPCVLPSKALPRPVS
jgi:hypothetical protein